jgi:glycogen debranching enzyme
VLTVLEGNTFLVADDHGDVSGGSHGLFFNDTRYISLWCLRLDGRRPDLLSSRTVDYYSAAVFLQNPASGDLPAGSVSLIRDVFVGEAGLQESLRLENHLIDPVELEVELRFDADFLDLFEVKARAYRHEELVFTDQTEPPISVARHRDDDENSWAFTLHTGSGSFTAQALVWTSREGHADDGSVRHRVSLEPGGSWETRTHVVLLRGEERRRERYSSFYFGEERQRVGKSLQAWRMSVPELDTDWEDLRHTFDRSIADLAALRMRPVGRAESLRDLPAAGLPWFMTVFGRDTLITSLQTLMLGPTLAIGTLETLAALQADGRDDLRDAEPGKIVHELRTGRIAEEGGAFPYYGSVDATLLFLILLSEVYRWTASTDLVRVMREPALAALRWMAEEADLLDIGYVAYQRRSPRGLETQTWKDSWDSMRFRDGTIARPPIAGCEVQGYAYDARLRCAQLAREVWEDPSLADRLEAEAADLRSRFNDDFFIETASGGRFALGLDRDGRQIDSLCSNIGHLLWSGIVADERVDQTADQLLSPELFSGWGVRTMSEADRGFNPIGYHTGTVWPHDNSLIVAGLRRHGYRQYARRISSAMFDAARHFDYRLPEVFAGYPRSLTPFPVGYPTACSPQAWAAGAPILCLTELLGLRPDPSSQTLRMDADLPDRCSILRLHGVAAFGKRYEVTAIGGRGTIRELP